MAAVRRVRAVRRFVRVLAAALCLWRLPRVGPRSQTRAGAWGVVRLRLTRVYCVREPKYKDPPPLPATRTRVLRRNSQHCASRRLTFPGTYFSSGRMAERSCGRPERGRSQLERLAVHDLAGAKLPPKETEPPRCALEFHASLCSHTAPLMPQRAL
jgi:hypothetical protein